MVIVGFTVCRDKILVGQKQTTIREPRKREWKVGEDILNLFWGLRTQFCYRLFDVPLERVERVELGDFTEVIALADGFRSLPECRAWFNSTHKKYIQSEKCQGFDILHWDFQKRFNVISQYELLRHECRKLQTIFQETLEIEVTCIPDDSLEGVNIEVPSQNICAVTSNSESNSVFIHLKK